MIGLQGKTLIFELIYKVSLMGGYENTDPQYTSGIFLSICTRFLKHWMLMS